MVNVVPFTSLCGLCHFSPVGFHIDFLSLSRCHALTLVILVFFIILVRSGCDEGGICVFFLSRVFVCLWGFSCLGFQNDVQNDVFPGALFRMFYIRKLHFGKCFENVVLLAASLYDLNVL